MIHSSLRHSPASQRLGNVANCAIRPVRSHPLRYVGHLCVQCWRHFRFRPAPSPIGFVFIAGLMAGFSSVPRVLSACFRIQPGCRHLHSKASGHVTLYACAHRNQLLVQTTYFFYPRVNFLSDSLENFCHFLYCKMWGAIIHCVTKNGHPFYFFHNSLKWRSIYTKFLSDVADEMLIQNIWTKYG